MDKIKSGIKSKDIVKT